MQYWKAAPGSSPIAADRRVNQLTPAQHARTLHQWLLHPLQEALQNSKHQASVGRMLHWGVMTLNVMMLSKT